jgi:hypothetical protein
LERLMSSPAAAAASASASSDTVSMAGSITIYRPHRAAGISRLTGLAGTHTVGGLSELRNNLYPAREERRLRPQWTISARQRGGPRERKARGGAHCRQRWSHARAQAALLAVALAQPVLAPSGLNDAPSSTISSQ